MRFVDANVILRYLLDDDPQLAEKATKILEQGKCMFLSKSWRKLSM